MIGSYGSMQGELYWPCPGTVKMQRLRAEGYRFCHTRSARKHRRQGHEVRWVFDNYYAWKVKDHG